MKKHLLAVIFLLFQCAGVLSQSSYWGKVSPEELSMKYCRFEPKAKAVILKEEAVYSFDVLSGDPQLSEDEVLDAMTLHFYNGSSPLSKLKYNIHYYKRTKILTRAGLSEARVTMTFQHARDYERIFAIQAQTINVDENGKTVIEVLDIDEIYKFQRDRKTTEIQFSFPSPKVGSILELSYIKKVKNIYLLQPWYFQHDIPAVHSKVTLLPPRVLEYRAFKRGDLLAEQYPQPVSIPEWELHNIPSLKQDKYIGSINDYRSHLKFQPVILKNLNWDRLGALWHNDPMVQTYLNDSSLRPVLSALLDSHGPEPSLEETLSWFQDNYTWNSDYHFLPNLPLPKLQIQKKGNSAALNFLLIRLLQELNIPSNAVLISTHDHGQMDKGYFSLSQFNHLIAWVNHADNRELIDAINLNYRDGFLPEQDYNEVGLAVEREKAHWIEIRSPRNNTISADGTVAFDFSGKVNAAIDLSLTGQDAGRVHSMDSAEYQQLFDPAYKVASASFKKENHESGELQVELRRPIRRGEKVAQIKFSPWLLSQFQKEFLTMRTRKVPIDFIYPQSISYRLKVHIPSGYKVVSYPEAMELRLYGQMGALQYQIEKHDEWMIVKIDIKHSQALFPASRYHHLKQYYGKMVKQLSASIVLERDPNSLLTKSKMEEQ